MRDSYPPHPDNDICGFSETDGDSADPTAFAPFAPSFARLHDLESLDLSGLQVACVNILFTSHVWFAAHMRCLFVETNDSCTGCGWKNCHQVLAILNALLDSFKLASFHIGGLPLNYRELPWAQYNLVVPTLDYVSCGWASVLRYNQLVRHRYRLLLHWNFRLQCNVMRFDVLPSLTHRRPHFIAAPNALSITQRLWLLRSSGHALLLLKLLMLDPIQRITYRHAFYRTVRRVNSEAVAARLVGMPCVNLRLSGQSGDFLHSLTADPCDTVSAVKAKVLSALGWKPVIPGSDVLRFDFAGTLLQDDMSLAECGIIPNDTIDMAFTDDGPVEIRVQNMTGYHTKSGPYFVTVRMKSSDTIANLKIRLLFQLGFLPSRGVLILHGKLMSDDDSLTLADYGITHNSWSENSVLRLLLCLRGFLPN